MNILITGGYGFIGFHTAERFYKEGHKIFIIDNLANKCEGDLKIKHTFFNVDVHSRKCEEVFKSNHFDLVIHLAGQSDCITSHDIPYIDCRTNVLGLLNILQLSRKYNVKKFIYISTVLVYDKASTLPYTEASAINPNSPYSTSKYAGELYCKKWSELYNFNTAILRLTYVYGPYQTHLGEGAVISSLINDALKNNTFTICKDNNRTLDLLYIGDAVDAIYKTYEKDFEGVLNISSGMEVTISEIFEKVKLYTGHSDISCKNTNKLDRERVLADNSNALTNLNWNVKYSFDEGMKETISYYINNRKHKVKKNTEEEKGYKELLKKLIPYAENLIGFLILFFIYKNTANKFDNILNNPIDYAFIYIILISVMYGTNQALISIVLASALYIGSYISIGGDLINFVYEMKYLLHIALYTIIGISIGYSIDRKNNDLYTNSIKIQSLNEKYDFLSEIYETTRKAKNELQSQIINSEDNFGRIFSAARALESLEIEDIFNSAVNVIMNITKSDEVSIYSLNKEGNFLRLKSKSKNLPSYLPLSIEINEASPYFNLISSKKLFVNKQLKGDLPIMAAPILDNDVVRGLIVIHSLPFENISLYHQNLFKVLVYLISNSLIKAYRYEEATISNRYIKNTIILKENYFKGILKSKIEARNNLKIDFTLLRFRSNTTIEMLNLKLSQVIRDSDFVGTSDTLDFYIILSNMSKQNSDLVLERLKSKGIFATILDGEDAYV